MRRTRIVVRSAVGGFGRLRVNHLGESFEPDALFSRAAEVGSTRTTSDLSQRSKSNGGFAAYQIRLPVRARVVSWDRQLKIGQVSSLSIGVVTIIAIVISSPGRSRVNDDMTSSLFLVLNNSQFPTLTSLDPMPSLKRYRI